MKIINENLPWIAPTAAIVLFGTGFFDRVTDAFTGGDTAAPAVVAATTVANVAVPTAAETVPVFVAPESAAVVFAVADLTRRLRPVWRHWLRRHQSNLKSPVAIRRAPWLLHRLNLHLYPKVLAQAPMLRRFSQMRRQI